MTTLALSIRSPDTLVQFRTPHKILHILNMMTEPPFQPQSLSTTTI